MGTKCIALNLDAPLQSWGYQSRFNERTTLNYPTRSGILGMVCAAMGIGRSDLKGLERLAELELTIYLLKHGDGFLRDFHTVGGGWDRKSHPMNVVPKASDALGKNSGQTVITHREYLQGYKFGALLRGEHELIEEIAAALHDPVWGLWLGRKACIPAAPVCLGVYDQPDEARNALETLHGEDLQGRRRILETSSFNEGTDSLMDIPLDYQQRRYGPRRVSVE